MACGGLHCSGCVGGMAVPVVSLLELCGAAWIAEHLVEVAVVSAVCGALAVAAVAALMRWQERREARNAAEASLWSARADALPYPRRRTVGHVERPALGFRDLHIHLDGQPTAEQAAVIRQAINGGT